MEPSHESRRRGLPALVGALAVLAARLAVALARQDTWYPFEVHSGSIAQALLDGVALDVAHLPIVAHARGSALFGVLLVPFYALGGASSFTMKLLPVVWHAATVALLAHLLERFYTRRAAWCAVLVVLAAPPMLQKLSTLGLASHMESSLPFLATWGAWLAISRDGWTRARALRLGLAAGFSAFFHLQALIPAVLVLGLCALQARRRLLSREGAWLAAGFAASAAPSFLFEGGALQLLVAGVFTADVSGPQAVEAGALEKLYGLFGGDLAAALEYGVAPGSMGAWLGPLAVLALGAGALAGLLAQRRPPREALVFGLHAGLVGALYAASNLEVVRELGAGATNRHLAPLVTSLLVLTAVGAARGRWTLAPVLVLTACGALAYPGLLGGSEAARTRQRGECYEWFTRHLLLEAGGDPEAYAALLERVDRGDARFRALRFARVPRDAAARAEALLASGAVPAVGATDGPAALLEWAGLGQVLARERDALAGAAGGGHLSGLTPDAREALLHGVGLGLQPPRGKTGAAAVDAFVAELRAWLAALPADDARAVLEGYGFQLGFVFDPYNTNMAEVLARHAVFEDELGAAFARGLGWGARQRLLEPPDAVPRGLVLAECVDPRHAADFAAAWGARALPR